MTTHGPTLVFLAALLASFVPFRGGLLAVPLAGLVHGGIGFALALLGPGPGCADWRADRSLWQTVAYWPDAAYAEVIEGGLPLGRFVAPGACAPS